MNDLTRFYQEEAPGAAAALAEMNRMDLESNQMSGFGLKSRVSEFLDSCRKLLFPTIYCPGDTPDELLPALINENLVKAGRDLNAMIRQVFVDRCKLDAKFTEACRECVPQADRATAAFLRRLPEVRKLLSTDIEAAYLGDPAARSAEEILLSYPSLSAITTYRLAHELFKMQVPLIPRIMTELSHSETGIDIHPGAQIGPYFFIDHGTGVVIGETTTIGHHVKLYQGVTLGAKSFELDENGNPVKGGKRHPDLGDNVVVYAGATILGGTTKIGSNSVVGGSVWLTSSIPENSNVYQSAPAPHIREK